MKFFLLFIIFTANGSCWDKLRYNEADNSLYIGVIRIVSAPINMTSQDLSFWDNSNRKLIKIQSGYIYGNPVTSYNYNTASTSTREVVHLDYFKFTYDYWGYFPRDRNGKIIGDYGPNYSVLFDDERQRGNPYNDGTSPGTHWVSTYQLSFVPSGKSGRWVNIETRTGYVKWSRELYIAPTPSDVPTSEEITTLPPEIELILNPPKIAIPTGTLSLSKSRGSGGLINVEFEIR